MKKLQSLTNFLFHSTRNLRSTIPDCVNKIKKKCVKGKILIQCKDILILIKKKEESNVGLEKKEDRQRNDRLTSEKGKEKGRKNYSSNVGDVVTIQLHDTISYISI